MLKKVGFFRELSHGEPDGISLKNSVKEKSYKDEDKIIKYLQKGIILVACGGIVEDCINPQKGIIGCPDIMTDGVWIWPRDLIYYVKNYHVKLDDNFVKHMEDNRWRIEKETIEITNLEF